MAVFVFTGTNPGRADHHRRDGSGQPRGRGGATPLAAGHRHRRAREAEGHHDSRHRQQGLGEGDRGLHAPVRHHDRRRPAAGPVPGDPGLAAREQDLQEDPDGDPAIRGRGRHLRRRPQAAPQGLQLPLRQHGGGGRGGRHPGHHPEPAGPVHGKGDEPQEEGQVGHDLPVHHRHGGGGGRDLPAGLRHPDLQGDVRGVRRRASAADPDRAGSSPASSATTSWSGWPSIAGDDRRGEVVVRHGGRAGNGSTRSCSRRRSSGS